ncbi:MAG: DsrH/TusB family sulfur metabolism protein [Pseudomonadota bacterium]
MSDAPTNTPLHLVQRRVAWASCAAVRAAGEPVVLVGDGVAAILDGAADCYALAADLTALGLEQRMPATVQPIDDERWVALCAAHGPIVSWSRE